MHLIHTSTLRLHEFFGDTVPKYAILSHTWEDEEVSFNDMQSFELSQLRQKRGFQKIEYTCAEARKRGLGWAWVDACCIDKSSSAELSEAINSMYTWYQRSEVCFAYLSDVPNDANPRPMRSSFRLSRWFSRGWTLQELIAPAQVIFYGANWSFIGDKLLLCMVLEDTTGIPCDLLLGHKGMECFSIAQRMAWASKRQTTRVEDTAYCLLGLCDINMPLLYGEGVKAFRRLQEEIIKQTDDQSLFAWTVEPDSPMAWTLGSVLATSPADFARSSQIHRLHEELGDPSVVTKKGVQVHAPLLPIRDYPIDRLLYKYCGRSAVPGHTLYRMPLNCVFHQERVCLAVMRIDSAAFVPHASEATNAREKSSAGHLFVRILLPTWDTEEDKPKFWDLDRFDKFFLRTNLSALNQNVFKSESGCFHFHGINMIFGNAVQHASDSPGSWYLVEMHRDYQAGRRAVDIPTFHEIGAINTWGFLYIPPSPWIPPSNHVYLDYHQSKGYRVKRLPRASTAKSKFFRIEGPAGCPPLYLVCGITQDPNSEKYRGRGPQSEPREGFVAEPYIFCNLLPQLDPGIFRRCSFLVFQPRGRIGRLIALEAQYGRTAVSVDLHRDKGFDSSGVQYRTGYKVPGGPGPHFIFEINARTVDGSAQNADDSGYQHQLHLDDNGAGSFTGLGRHESADGASLSRKSSKLSSDISSDFGSQASSHATDSTEYEFEDYWCDIYTSSIDGTLEFQEQYRL